MSAPEYTIETLLDIASLPEDAFPRFLAELPAMIAHMRALKLVVAEANALTGSDALAMRSTPVVWVDDGERFERMALSLGDGEEPRVLFDTFPAEGATQ